MAVNVLNRPVTVMLKYHDKDNSCPLHSAFTQFFDGRHAL